MKKNIKFILLTLFIWIAISAFSTVNAASATIKADKTSATVGDSVKVTVTVNAAAWNLKVSGSASGDIIGYNQDAENQTTTKTYTIDTSKAGTYTVKLSGDITDESKDTADQINKSVSISVKAKETTSSSSSSNSNSSSNTNSSSNSSNSSSTTTTKEKSNNANLSTLGITPKEYDFSGFSKNKTSYSVTIPRNVDSLKVLYKTADSNAKVSVSGNSGFEVGSNNKITVKVTAEDGKTTKTYTIKVTQLAEEEEKPGNLIDNAEELYLTSLKIEGIELTPEFAKDTYSYTATLNDASINELKIEAKANNEKANINISGNTELVVGENTINILVTLDDSETQAIYQIVLTKNESEESIMTTEENNKPSTMNYLIEAVQGYVGVVILVIVLMVVALIVLIILLRRENKKLDDDEEDDIEFDKTEEYNVYKNDENEFKNNDIEKDNFIESLYKQRNGEVEEELTEDEKETIEEIRNQTNKIFEEKEVEGQNVEYNSNEDDIENPLEKRRKRRGKHSL